MNFVPTGEYMEVSLQEGLNALQIGKAEKLFSDGLEDYEYIYYDDSNGFCYEDGCVIGETFDRAIDVLHSVGWCYDHRFFVMDK